MTPGQRQGWRYLRSLAVPILLWCLFVYVLSDALHVKDHDADTLREWIDLSIVSRLTLPEMVRDYVNDADPDTGHLDRLGNDEEQIAEYLRALGKPPKIYRDQLPLFPSIYRLELEFPGNPKLQPIVWESRIPRPRQPGQVLTLEHQLLGPDDGRAVLRVEYQLHAFNKRQRAEQLANLRLRWISGLTIAATALALFWIILAQRRESERGRQRERERQQLDQAERLALENELRRREAERHKEDAERDLLEQRLATQAAERQALELKSQLYASIGIMAGSYAHNIKNLLVRPNDLLRRCLEADGLSGDQGRMLHEVRDTLGAVTERLQQILRTVRRDPHRAIMERLDLNVLVRDIERTWQDLAREKWKLELTTELADGPMWIEGDLSHLQQAVENLVFNARDATFEKRGALREQARRSGNGEGGVALRHALIEAAAWMGRVVLRTRRDGDGVILEVTDNGIGMTDDVRSHCTETHFTTKRDNALYEGINTGTGLGLSFVVVVLTNHRAALAIDSQPLGGATFRVTFPPPGVK